MNFASFVLFADRFKKFGELKAEELLLRYLNGYVNSVNSVKKSVTFNLQNPEKMSENT